MICKVYGILVQGELSACKTDGFVLFPKGGAVEFIDLRFALCHGARHRFHCIQRWLAGEPGAIGYVI